MTIRFLKLSLASSKSIRSWTERILPNGKKVGKILKGDLIDYKNGLPIRDGLSCERIFGPMVSFTCSCGRFKGIETRGIHIVHDTGRVSKQPSPFLNDQKKPYNETVKLNFTENLKNKNRPWPVANQDYTYVTSDLSTKNFKLSFVSPRDFLVNFNYFVNINKLYITKFHNFRFYLLFLFFPNISVKTMLQMYFITINNKYKFSLKIAEGRHSQYINKQRLNSTGHRLLSILIAEGRHNKFYNIACFKANQNSNFIYNTKHRIMKKTSFKIYVSPYALFIAQWKYKQKQKRKQQTMFCKTYKIKRSCKIVNRRPRLFSPLYKQKQDYKILKKKNSLVRQWSEAKNLSTIIFDKIVFNYNSLLTINKKNTFFVSLSLSIHYNFFEKKQHNPAKSNNDKHKEEINLKQFIKNFFNVYLSLIHSLYFFKYFFKINKIFIILAPSHRIISEHRLISGYRLIKENFSYKKKITKNSNYLPYLRQYRQIFLLSTSLRRAMLKQTYNLKILPLVSWVSLYGYNYYNIDNYRFALTRVLHYVNPWKWKQHRQHYFNNHKQWVKTDFNQVSFKIMGLCDYKIKNLAASVFTFYSMYKTTHSDKRNRWSIKQDAYKRLFFLIIFMLHKNNKKSKHKQNNAKLLTTLEHKQYNKIIRQTYGKNNIKQYDENKQKHIINNVLQKKQNVIDNISSPPRVGKVYKFKTFPPEEIRYCPYCEVELLPNSIRRYRLGYIEFVSPVAHIWYNATSIPLLLNLSKTFVEGIAACVCCLSSGFPPIYRWSYNGEIPISWAFQMQPLKLPISLNTIISSYNSVNSLHYEKNLAFNKKSIIQKKIVFLENSSYFWPLNFENKNIFTKFPLSFDFKLCSSCSVIPSMTKHKYLIKILQATTFSQTTALLNLPHYFKQNSNSNNNNLNSVHFVFKQWLMKKKKNMKNNYYFPLNYFRFYPIILFFSKNFFYNVPHYLLFQTSFSRLNFAYRLGFPLMFNLRKNINRAFTSSFLDCVYRFRLYLKSYNNTAFGKTARHFSLLTKKSYEIEIVRQTKFNTKKNNGLSSSLPSALNIDSYQTNLWNEGPINRNNGIERTPFISMEWILQIIKHPYKYKPNFMYNGKQSFKYNFKNYYKKTLPVVSQQFSLKSGILLIIFYYLYGKNFKNTMVKNILYKTFFYKLMFHGFAKSNEKQQASIEGRWNIFDPKENPLYNDFLTSTQFKKLNEFSELQKKQNWLKLEGFYETNDYKQNKYDQKDSSASVPLVLPFLGKTTNNHNVLFKSRYYNYNKYFLMDNYVELFSFPNFYDDSVKYDPMTFDNFKQRLNTVYRSTWPYNIKYNRILISGFHLIAKNNKRQNKSVNYHKSTELRGTQKLCIYNYSYKWYPKNSYFHKNPRQIYTCLPSLVSKNLKNLTYKHNITNFDNNPFLDTMNISLLFFYYNDYIASKNIKQNFRPINEYIIKYEIQPTQNKTMKYDLNFILKKYKYTKPVVEQYTKQYDETQRNSFFGSLLNLPKISQQAKQKTNKDHVLPLFSNLHNSSYYCNKPINEALNIIDSKPTHENKEHEEPNLYKRPDYTNIEHNTKNKTTLSLLLSQNAYYLETSVYYFQLEHNSRLKKAFLKNLFYRNKLYKNIKAWPLYNKYKSLFNSMRLSKTQKYSPRPLPCKTKFFFENTSCRLQLSCMHNVQNKKKQSFTVIHAYRWNPKINYYTTPISTVYSFNMCGYEIIKNNDYYTNPMISHDVNSVLLYKKPRFTTNGFYHFTCYKVIKSKLLNTMKSNIYDSIKTLRRLKLFHCLYLNFGFYKTYTQALHHDKQWNVTQKIHFYKKSWNFRNKVKALFIAKAWLENIKYSIKAKRKLKIMEWNSIFQNNIIKYSNILVKQWLIIHKYKQLKLFTQKSIFTKLSKKNSIINNCFIVKMQPFVYNHRYCLNWKEYIREIFNNFNKTLFDVYGSRVCATNNKKLYTVFHHPILWDETHNNCFYNKIYKKQHISIMSLKLYNQVEDKNKISLINDSNKKNCQFSRPRLTTYASLKLNIIQCLKRPITMLAYVLNCNQTFYNKSTIMFRFTSKIERIFKTSHCVYSSGVCFAWKETSNKVFHYCVQYDKNKKIAHNSTISKINNTVRSCEITFFYNLKFYNSIKQQIMNNNTIVLKLLNRWLQDLDFYNVNTIIHSTKYSNKPSLDLKSPPSKNNNINKTQFNNKRRLNAIGHRLLSIFIAEGRHKKIIKKPCLTTTHYANVIEFFGSMKIYAKRNFLKLWQHFRKPKTFNTLTIINQTLPLEENSRRKFYIAPGYRLIKKKSKLSKIITHNCVQAKKYNKTVKLFNTIRFQFLLDEYIIHKIRNIQTFTFFQWPRSNSWKTGPYKNFYFLFAQTMTWGYKNNNNEKKKLMRSFSLPYTMKCNSNENIKNNCFFSKTSNEIQNKPIILNVGNSNKNTFLQKSSYKHYYSFKSTKNTNYYGCISQITTWGSDHPSWVLFLKYIRANIFKGDFLLPAYNNKTLFQMMPRTGSIMLEQLLSELSFKSNYDSSNDLKLNLPFKRNYTSLNEHKALSSPHTNDNHKIAEERIIKKYNNRLLKQNFMVKSIINYHSCYSSKFRSYPITLYNDKMCVYNNIMTPFGYFMKRPRFTTTHYAYYVYGSFFNIANKKKTSEALHRFSQWGNKPTIYALLFYNYTKAWPRNILLQTQFSRNKANAWVCSKQNDEFFDNYSLHKDHSFNSRNDENVKYNFIKFNKILNKKPIFTRQWPVAKNLYSQTSYVSIKHKAVAWGNNININNLLPGHCLVFNNLILNNKERLGSKTYKIKKPIYYNRFNQTNIFMSKPGVSIKHNYSNYKYSYNALSIKQNYVKNIKYNNTIDKNQNFAFMQRFKKTRLKSFISLNSNNKDEFYYYYRLNSFFTTWPNSYNYSSCPINNNIRSRLETMFSKHMIYFSLNIVKFLYYLIISFYQVFDNKQEFILKKNKIITNYYSINNGNNFPKYNKIFKNVKQWPGAKFLNKTNSPLSILNSCLSSFPLYDKQKQNLMINDVLQNFYFSYKKNYVYNIFLPTDQRLTNKVNFISSLPISLNSKQSLKQQNSTNNYSLCNISNVKRHNCSQTWPLLKSELFFIILKEIGNYRNIIKKNNSIFKTYILKMNSWLEPYINNNSTPIIPFQKHNETKNFNFQRTINKHNEKNQRRSLETTIFHYPSCYPILTIKNSNKILKLLFKLYRNCFVSNFQQKSPILQRHSMLCVYYIPCYSIKSNNKLETNRQKYKIFSKKLLNNMQFFNNFNYLPLTKFLFFGSRVCFVSNKLTNKVFYKSSQWGRHGFFNYTISYDRCKTINKNLNIAILWSNKSNGKIRPLKNKRLFGKLYNNNPTSSGLTNKSFLKCYNYRKNFLQKKLLKQRIHLTILYDNNINLSIFYGCDKREINTSFMNYFAPYILQKRHNLYFDFYLRQWFGAKFEFYIKPFTNYRTGFRVLTYDNIQKNSTTLLNSDVLKNNKKDPSSYITQCLTDSNGSVIIDSKHKHENETMKFSHSHNEPMKQDHVHFSKENDNLSTRVLSKSYLELLKKTNFWVFPNSSSYIEKTSEALQDKQEVKPLKLHSTTHSAIYLSVLNQGKTHNIWPRFYIHFTNRKKKKPLIWDKKNQKCGIFPYVVWFQAPPIIPLYKTQYYEIINGPIFSPLAETWPGNIYTGTQNRIFKYYPKASSEMKSYDKKNIIISKKAMVYGNDDSMNNINKHKIKSKNYVFKNYALPQVTALKHNKIKWNYNTTYVLKRQQLFNNFFNIKQSDNIQLLSSFEMSWNINYVFKKPHLNSVPIVYVRFSLKNDKIDYVVLPFYNYALTTNRQTSASKKKNNVSSQKLLLWDLNKATKWNLNSTYTNNSTLSFLDSSSHLNIRSPLTAKLNNIIKENHTPISRTPNKVINIDTNEATKSNVNNSLLPTYRTRNLRRLRLQYLRNFRRLRFIEYLKATSIKHESMILSLLPVLPPDLRPVIANPRGYITGDINTHYQNVIYRNNNIEKLLDTFWIPKKFYRKNDSEIVKTFYNYFSYRPHYHVMNLQECYPSFQSDFSLFRIRFISTVNIFYNLLLKNEASKLNINQQKTPFYNYDYDFTSFSLNNETYPQDIAYVQTTAFPQVNALHKNFVKQINPFQAKLWNKSFDFQYTRNKHKIDTLRSRINTVNNVFYNLPPLPFIEAKKNRCQVLHDSKPLQEMQYSLQKAVDALIDNSQKLQYNVLLRKGRPLKSLSDSLKGKEGRFRQHLLGKRVDYSGRSVIIVGPQLKLYECGIPLIMALRLFQPFLILYLIYKFKIASLLATQLIQRKHPMIINLLKKFIQTWPVLLNRAPTLHRMNIQAFKIRLVQGKAILLHPLVCSSYNADFDGDQMGVHIPITQQARAESWKLLWSINNSISIASRQPLFLPSQDMVIGNYYLTQNPYHYTNYEPFMKISNTNTWPYLFNKINVLKNQALSLFSIQTQQLCKTQNATNHHLLTGQRLNENLDVLTNYSWKNICHRPSLYNEYYDYGFFSIQEAYQYYCNSASHYHVNTPIWFHSNNAFETEIREKCIEIIFDKNGNSIYISKYYERQFKRNRLLTPFSSFTSHKHEKNNIYKTVACVKYNKFATYEQIFNRILNPICYNQIIRSTFGRIEFYYETFIDFL